MARYGIERNHFCGFFAAAFFSIFNLYQIFSLAQVNLDFPGFNKR